MDVTGGLRARAGVVFVDVRPDLDGFSRTILSKTTSNKFANAGKLMGKALLTGVAAVGVGAAIVGKLAIDAAIEAEKVMAQTDAVIKSTGGAAKVTAEDVSSMAERIMNLSGVSDETVASGQNLLLTFTNIRNTVKGEFVGVFDEATMAITDMSVALDQDMKSSAIQVGKALNDPIKGLTALQRVGVAFTDDQKEMVKRWVEHGDVVKAQKFILAELNKEFGGSAKAMGETTAGKVNILKERFGNLMEEVGFRLIPFLVKLTELAGVFLPKAFAFVEKAVQSVVGWFKSGSQGAEGLGASFGGVLAWAQKIWPQVQDIIAKWVEFVQLLWSKWGENILNIARRVWSHIGQTIENVLRVAKGVIDLFLSVLKGDWTGAWNAIKNIVGGIWEQIKDSLSNVLGVIKEIIIGAWRTIRTVVADIVGGILAFLTRNFANFLEFFFNVAEGILDAAAFAFGWIPKIGKRIRGFRDDFERDTGAIIRNIQRQADEFEAMGEKSTKALKMTAREVRNLYSLVAKSVGGIAIDVTSKLGFGGGIGSGLPGAMSLVGIGHWLQGQGFSVAGHSAFPPIGRHTQGSFHYVDRAIDVNWPDKAAEPGVLASVAAKVQTLLGRRIVESLGPWNDPAHGGSNTHWHLAMDRGGIVKGPATIQQGNIWEAHIPLTGPQSQQPLQLVGTGEFEIRNSKTYLRTTMRQIFREP